MTKFLVCKLLKKIETNDYQVNLDRNGCAGMMVVFNERKDAEEFADKCEILEVEVSTQHLTQPEAGA